VLSVSVAKRDAGHAVAVLSGLTSSEGGMVAAATTSLPERADAGRNYDYRFAWIRDQSFAGEAAAVAGVEPLLDSAVAFVRDRLLSDGVRLRPVYRVDGAVAGQQHQLRLPGYPGASEVFVGNAASDQFQLDCFGEALQLFAVAAEHDRLSREVWQAVEVAARGIEERWHEDDYGVWETRARQWTHSRLVCAAGLARVSRYAPPIEASRWSQLSERILVTASERSVHPSGRWQRAPDDPDVDAALLIPQIRGLLPVDDPRSRATLNAVIHELTEDGLVYRYRHGDGCSEGAFLLCSFWLSLATLQAHDTVGSARWFERARAACGPPGLFAEEFDVEQRQLRGNLPQAFVHALLLETACRQSRHPDAEREPGRR
jgi:GH15 family glucan-1,4-alpha-glucosidase